LIIKNDKVKDITRAHLEEVLKYTREMEEEDIARHYMIEPPDRDRSVGAGGRET
jgi:hypothetical protein